MNKRNAARARRVELDRVRFDFGSGHMTIADYRAAMERLAA